MRSQLFVGLLCLGVACQDAQGASVSLSAEQPNCSGAARKAADGIIDHEWVDEQTLRIESWEIGLSDYEVDPDSARAEVVGDILYVSFRRKPIPHSNSGPFTSCIPTDHLKFLVSGISKEVKNAVLEVRESLHHFGVGG